MEKREISVVISGSFRRHYDAIKSAIKDFENLDVKVLSPKSSQIINPGEEVAILATDDVQSPDILEKRHLEAIQRADALYISNPEGYLGASTILELGWANALGKPIFSSDASTDATIKFFSGGAATPREVKEALAKRSPVDALTPQSSLAQLQAYVREMVVRRGFEKETPQDVLMFFVEETGELAKAMRKYLGRKTDKEKIDRYGNVEDELADMLIYLIDLANILEVPLFEALYKKEQENEKRIWN